MKIFFDTEFTGLHKGTELISIGMVDEVGRTFYAEFNDYDKNQIEDWIEDNVISNLLFEDQVKFFRESQDTMITNCKGNKEYIRKMLLDWLEGYDTIEFVSDVCHYDFVLLIDLISFNALDLPKNIAPVCIDINQMLMDHYSMDANIAFDINRERIVEVDDDNKHNSLHDAKVIKAIYNKITNE